MRSDAGQRIFFYTPHNEFNASFTSTPMSPPSGRGSEATDLLPHPRKFVVSWRHLLSLLVLALSFYLVPLYRTTRDLYAVCTKNEARIYTVDATNSQAQCIVIQRPYIIDRGALRESYNLRSTACPSLPHAGDIKERWSSFSFRKISPLKIHFIAPDAIVVPGLSGSYLNVQSVDVPTHSITYRFPCPYLRIWGCSTTAS